MDFCKGDLLESCHERRKKNINKLTKFFTSVQVIHSSPRIDCATGDQTSGFAVDGRTGDFVSEIEMLEKPARHKAVEKVDAFPCSDAKDIWVIWPYCEAVELARTDGAFDSIFDDRIACAKIPPPDLAVFCGCREDIVILVPDDRLDRAAVHARANLVAGHVRARLNGTPAGQWGRRAVAAAAAAGAAG